MDKVDELRKVRDSLREIFTSVYELQEEYEFMELLLRINAATVITNEQIKYLKGGEF